LISLDTNLLVRYVTADDPAQADKVGRLLARAQAEQTAVLICDVVLCELAWVLKDCYDQERAQIAEVLEGLLHSSVFVFQQKDCLWAALADYRKGKGGFADYVIGRTGKSAGAVRTYTFDRTLRSSECFELLG
jgi:predicted nucleic-acid-binding protein